MRGLRWAPLVLMVASGLTACAARDRAPATNGASHALLVIGYDREPDTMNRYATHILEDIQTCIIEGLTTADDSMRVVPVLAREVPTIANGGVHLRADGGMDVTWKLRPGVTWHDGVPHTSADVQFTVDRINSPDWNPESTDGFDRIASVETPDALTAIVHYKEVYAAYALQFARGTLPKHVLEGKDMDRDQYNRMPLGTGPYRLAEWKTGEYALLERVPSYWRGAGMPKIERLQFRFIANTNTRINQLKAGEVHLVAFVPWDQHREIEQMPGVVLHRVLGNGYEHITLNERSVPAFREVAVRRALLHAIDRNQIVEQVLDGLAPVIHGPVQPLSWAFTDSVRHYAFDPARARALLDSAGWRATLANGLRAKDGVPLRFTMITQAGFVTREQVAQTLQRQWRDIGVDAAIELVDGTAISKRWFTGGFEAMLHWWQMPADPDLTLFFAKDRTPPAGRNINYFEDAALTSVLYASDRTVDQAKRRTLLVQAQQMLAEQLPELPLYNTTKLDAIPASLRNFRGNPTNAGPFWNVWEWEIRP